ncbi:hypothetical protein EST38_g14560 [Candolleomyces aberdarensis]|uniref:Uncharacterized protein n=1 Tax=Candolleomyces aberdarensis TaxID=2316362 RepID=A0A4Q2CZM1_9AGAR|nr:hypothetical protein EST38_g14560 [Candolleomyces aberdarensis]
MDKIRASVDGICAWSKFLLVVDLQLTVLNDQKVLFKFREGSMEQYLQTPRMISQILDLDASLPPDFFSTAEFSDLLVWLWTAKDKDGALWSIKKSSEILSQGCPIIDLMLTTVEGKDGKEGLLLHLASRPRRYIDAVVESIVERAKLVQDNADSQHPEQVMMFLLGLFEIALALRTNTWVQHGLSASHYLARFSSALEEVTRSLFKIQSKLPTKLLIHKGIFTLAVLANHDHRRSLLDWRDLLAGKLLLTLGRVLVVPVSEPNDDRMPFTRQGAHEASDDLLQTIAARIAFPSVLSRLALGLPNNELASIPINKDTENLWKVINAAKENLRIYRFLKETNTSYLCDYPKVRPLLFFFHIYQYGSDLERP